MTERHTTVTLFGTLSLYDGGGRRLIPRGRNVRALLVYLLLEGHTGLSRHHVAALIWPQMEAARRLSNLRVALSQLNRQLSLFHPAPLQRAERELGIAAEARIVSDASALEGELQATQLEPDALPQQAPLADLVAPSEAYAEWLERTRSRLLLIQQSLLARAARQALGAQAVAQARDLVDRMLALDPLNAEGHHLMAEVLAGAAAPATARCQIDRSRSLLQKHLQLETTQPVTVQTDGGGERPSIIASPQPRDPASWFPPGQRRKLDHFFRIFDENSDGIITWDDFATKLANLRAP
ncbi:MAG: hypothetical protein ACQETD_09980, partial [Pseudomonadota bacterium]